MNSTRNNEKNLPRVKRNLAHLSDWNLENMGKVQLSNCAQMSQSGTLYKTELEASSRDGVVKLSSKDDTMDKEEVKGGVKLVLGELTFYQWRYE